MTGKLKTIVGPMYAGKTSSILQEILWINHCNFKVLVVKPKTDNRYSQDHIETHNRLSYPCFAMNNWQEVVDNYTIMPYNYHTVFLDEVQFMDAVETVAQVNTMLTAGVNVVAAGLNQDSRGKPFEATAQLMALSDEVKLIQAICTVCGKPATKTQRTDNGSDRVAVGSVGMYEPRCLEHWTPQ
jgi:thymidine kinase